jgi:hypothetical protein
MPRIIWLVILFFLSGFLFALSEYAFDSNKDGKPDKWYSYDNGFITFEKDDLNFDGVVDYIAQFDQNGRKKSEELDNNFDGEMDTFYYYENGKATLETIDSNYDGKLDIWIHLNGPYVLRYEEDTDFDGVVDKTKMFGAD